MNRYNSDIYLSKQVLRYNLLNSLPFTLSRWNEIAQIEREAYEFMHNVESGDILITTKSIKNSIKYIQTFATEKQAERVFARIQEYTEFNVKEYADRLAMTWQEKIMNLLKIKGNEYLTTDQMQHRVKAYKKLNHHVQYDTNVHNSDYEDIDDLREEAEDYAKAVNSGKVEVKPEDYKEFTKYISTLCAPLSEDSAEFSAVRKVQDLMEKASLPAVNNTQSENIKSGMAVKNKKQKEVVSKSENKVSLWKNAGSFFKTKMKSFGQKVSKNLKVATISILALAGTMLGVKKCQNSADTKINNIAENTVTTGKVVITDTINLNDTIKDSQYSAKSVEEKIWNNYYDNTIEILSSAEKKQQLYSQIHNQLDKGIFTLDNISPEKLAYAYLIYKEYGVKSSIGQALTADEKLSPEAQQQLVDDVMRAGNKGEGVKKIAAARNGGRLSSHSKYNKASKPLKEAHAKSLKQLVKLEKIKKARY